MAVRRPYADRPAERPGIRPPDRRGRAGSSGRMGGVPVEMSRERFEELVGDALDEVPEELLALMSNVVILVEDDPPPGEDLLGLYEGHALTERGWDYAGVLPDRILIYRNPILRICDDDEDVVDEVAVTVVHEIAHHFGIDDARLHELGWG
ncbi:Predicted Zn-dependent protease, minimal metalloprotease (MMP)-like domain [Micromonospora echinofusca]|uniref:Predicted Zn-dependent protease, minimal metalloprotease (MMP)-like domain n=2 Tax=Actinomycetes TaxID=1760 RepID=A0A1C5GHU8_MICEH|nr:Predicted Zn-dependent protease, minimal metalloprotease (MMP)-like domain [Micromonospora echinofusca]